MEKRPGSFNMLCASPPFPRPSAEVTLEGDPPFSFNLATTFSSLVPSSSYPPSLASTPSPLVARATTAATRRRSRTLHAPYEVPAKLSFSAPRRTLVQDSRTERAFEDMDPRYSQGWSGPSHHQVVVKNEPASPPMATSARRLSDGDKQASQPYGHSAYPNVMLRRGGSHPSERPGSSGSSSLAGAMGDARVSHEHAQRSGSPHPSGMVWSTSSDVHGMQEPFGMPFHASPTVTSYSSGGSPTTALNVPYQHYNSQAYFNTAPTPDSLSPVSPASFGSAPYGEYPYPQPRAGSSVQAPPMGMASSMPKSELYTDLSDMGLPQSFPMTGMGRHPPANGDDEIRYLRKRVRELELVSESTRMRVRELEMELAKDSPLHPAARHSPSGLTGLPSPIATPTPSPSFQASWRARTDARVKQFCSLNRAGNALCAWHDSRRERRAFPPRMAPPGHLNCGCTYEEALFEESLARHGVGSYHPGESVRMDPALRNPLLQLLQERYGYRDGDFERDPQTGNWVEGEGHMYWEQRANSGVAIRKMRPEERR